MDVLSELRCLLEKGEQAVLQVDSGEAAEGGQARPSSVSFFSDSCLSQSHQKRERERESNGCSLQAVAEGVLHEEGPSMPVSTFSPLSVDTQWRVRVSPCE